MIYHDVLVVGGGLAGLRAALEVNRNNLKVGVITKVHPVRSHSIAAQGGVNAALGNHARGVLDSVEKHAYDTVKGSDFLADQKAALRMTQDALVRIYEMEHWGCPFSRTEDGKIAQRPFGGAGFPRTCYSGDTTGHVMLHTLFEQIVRFEHASEREEMKVYDEWLVLSLAFEGGMVRGLVALDLASGRLEAFRADAIIFATGGAGRMYKNTTNALINTGMGMAVPYWAGVPLKDIEFIQFHPTTLVGTNILITEGARGEGGFLINNKGERFLANYPDSRKAMETAPRDIVARNMRTEILNGRGFEDSYLLLDLRHLGAEKIMQRLPGIRDICLNFAGIDPIDKPIPVQPGQHYTMGGIDCNIKCETVIKGFYAAGEGACVSVHGANRLGGNSLLDTVVFGAIAGEEACRYLQGASASAESDKLVKETLKQTEEKLNKLISSAGKENPSALREEMQTVMSEKVGIFRDASQLKEAHEQIQKLRERYKNIKLSYNGRKLNMDLMWAVELGGSLDAAEAVVAGALARQESRGSQFRTDFPMRDDAKWLKHTMAKYTPDGSSLSYSEVDTSIWKPAERRY